MCQVLSTERLSCARRRQRGFTASEKKDQCYNSSTQRVICKLDMLSSRHRRQTEKKKSQTPRGSYNVHNQNQKLKPQHHASSRQGRFVGLRRRRQKAKQKTTESVSQIIKEGIPITFSMQYSTTILPHATPGHEIMVPPEIGTGE